MRKTLTNIEEVGRIAALKILLTVSTVHVRSAEGITAAPTAFITLSFIARSVQRVAGFIIQPTYVGLTNLVIEPQKEQ